MITGDSTMPHILDFSILNNHFDHIYILSLRRAADRHEHFSKELAGLNYTIFYGQDKNDFDIESLIVDNIYDETEAIKNHRLGRPMTRGQICCSWSHRRIYEDILENKFDRVLILEDDVVIDRDTFSLIPQILKELPINWELVYFGFSKKEFTPSFAWIKKGFYHFLRLFNAIILTHKAISNLYPRKLNNHIYKSGYHDCTHAYALTASGAEKLISLQTPVVFIADHLLAYAATNELLSAYIIMPKIINQAHQVSQTDMFSYISK